MVTRKMPRVQEVLLPVLRAEIPGVSFTSWVPNIDDRVYPVVNLRRLSGISRNPKQIEKAVIEITVFHDKGLVDAEDLYLDVRQVLWEMVQKQTVTAVGHLCSFFETMGPTSFDSPFDDTFRVQGLIELGIRPPRT